MEPEISFGEHVKSNSHGQTPQITKHLLTGGTLVLRGNRLAWRGLLAVVRQQVYGEAVVDLRKGSASHPQQAW